jgi:glycosyltransferase involved in cell wall biosynthesis
MRSDRAALKDRADFAEDDRTEHLLKTGAVALLIKALGWIFAHPGHSLAAFRLAMAMGRVGAGGGDGTGGRLRHLIYLIEAACIAARARALGITHIHAHFGTNSTTVALLAHALGGPEYSFTAHGPEEFDAPHALSLGLKVARARFAVAISSFGRSQLCRWSEPEHWARIHVVHCSIETERFAAPPAIPDSVGPHLVAIGRMAPQKGFALLIEAMALAASELPELTLTLVGDGPLRAPLQAAVTARGLDGVVHFAGWQDEAGVRAALAASHALILPSFAEGLPVVVMEAFADARPAIATAIAGVPELVNSRSGWLVPAGDVLAVAAAIRELAATPRATLIDMGKAARARVMARHDSNIEAAKLLALMKGSQ